MVPDAKLQLALQRLETGQFSKADTRIIVCAYQSGQISLATGAGSVSVGGNTVNSIIVTGNGNSIVIGGSGAEAIQPVAIKPLLNIFINVFSSWLLLSAISSTIFVLNSPNNVNFFYYLFNFFGAYTLLGIAGIFYEVIFKNKDKHFDFDYPFIFWVIYPIKIIAEVEIKLMIFAFQIMLKFPRYLPISQTPFSFKGLSNRSSGSVSISSAAESLTTSVAHRQELSNIQKLIKDIHDNGYAKRFNPRIYKNLGIEVNERQWIETISMLVRSGQATEKLELTCPDCHETIDSYIKYQDIPLDQTIECIHCAHEFKVSEEHIIPMYSFSDNFDPRQELSVSEKYFDSLAKVRIQV